MRTLIEFASSLLFLLLLCRPLEASIEHESWDYDTKGPKMWPKLFQKFCSGRKQSPIALGVTTSVQDPTLTEYTMRVEDTTEYTLTIENDGHKLLVTLGPSLIIRIGQADTMYYTATQLHWHWGADSSRGSEHTLGGRAYPMEGHLVFWNSYDYANSSQAIHGVSGLAVLGVFYELSQNENPLLQAIEPYLPDLTAAGSKKVVTFKSTSLNFLNAFLPKTTRYFYRYEGSLTTPKCDENVLWTVYTHSVPISARQLGLLRSLRTSSGKPSVDNFRPVQPLNPPGRPGANRIVYRTFDRAGRTVGDVGYSPGGVAPGAVGAPALTAAAAALVARLFGGTVY